MTYLSTANGWPRKRKNTFLINPSNEKKIAEIAYADKSDVDLAVDATRKAYDGVWSKTLLPKEQNTSIE